ncbi:phosphate ABC transporter substrate-binding protein PstS [Salinicola sp. MH3R3-1]|uniref:phosphate ABC transporter substrate-binding protein PstS n=1 Tax=Salinicola sp. MH3R3-1 TaxID=1928762 RepID=UPI00094E6907|nr:phosphate ABC transporter substrate-binding protein PstS [Salinicola sp. MH3R3-1]OLO08609.1 phosphate ABC transporter substrate-binding protein PstS [Salinicola sp. MH3R3-1]
MLKHVFAALISGSMVLGAAGVQAQDSITGAGATFPYPVYSQWADAYQDESGIGLNYQAIGSGGGIQQIVAKTVTFGASDAPMTKEELDKNGLMQWPMVMGGVVAAFHVEGIEGDSLNLDGPTLADIYQGKITNWDDEAIAKLNPDMDLPDTQITPVYRADGSGTNFLFTHYLAQVSEDFANTVGEGKSVAWPAGVGAKANAGVASQVSNTNGAIGYVEYAYAEQNDLSLVHLKNQAGKVVAPDMDSFMAAAANADWKKAPGMYLVLTNQPGDKSWPITGASFILMHKEVQNADAARQALEFFDWAYSNGGDMAKKLDYVPMPENVADMVRDSWSEIKDSDGNAVWTK